MPSYQQNKTSKLWSVRFREVVDGESKQPRLSGYKTKREAQEAYRQHVNERESAQALKNAPQSPRMLMSQLIGLYLEHERTRVKESSLFIMQSKIGKNITPYFEGKYIDEIKPYDILEWQRTLEHYSFSHKSRLRGYLIAIYKYGERYHDTKNITHKVEPFRNLEGKKEMQFWSKEEFNIFISSVSDIMLYTLFWTLYVSGCRKGEALALSWTDIDFKTKTISITKSVTRKHAGKAWEITTPKNITSNRVIDIPDKLCAILKAYRKHQIAAKEDMTFIFCGVRPLAEQTLTRNFDIAIKKAGVKKIRIHDLRHSCASLLISEGVSIVAVSKRLGHANVEQTLNTYSHMMPNDKTKMLQVLNRI